MTDRSKDGWRTGLLFLLIAVVYLSNGRAVGTTDTIPARYLPFSIIRHGSFDLDAFPFLYRDPQIPHFVSVRHGHYVSTYPPTAAVVALPIYLLPVLAGLSPQSWLVPHLDKLSAAAIAVLSAVFLFLTLRRLGSRRTAVMVTGAYALGTSTFSVSSQALWQHGPGQLFLALGAYLLVRGVRDARYLAWSGLSLGAAVACRPTNVLLALPLFVYMLRSHRRDAVAWAALAAVPPMLLLGYYLHYFGSAAAYNTYRTDRLHFGGYPWDAPFAYALGGLLLSPYCGLFTYSPVLVPVLGGIGWAWRRPDQRLLRHVSVGLLLVVLAYSKWHFWWGFWYGPRLLADITPLLALFLWPVWEAAWTRTWSKVILGVLTGASIAIHAIGAFGYDSNWGSWLRREATMDEDRLWSWRASPPIHYGGELLRSATANLRRAEWRRAGLAGGPDAAAPREPASLWLGTQRTPVEIARRCDFEGAWGAEPARVPDPPHFGVMLDRVSYGAGEISELTLSLRNGRRARNVAAYLALRGPDGALQMGGHSLPPNPGCGEWVPLGGPAMVPKGFHVEFPMAFRLDGLPPGRYTWYAFLTEPGTARVVTRSSAEFTLARPEGQVR